MTSNSKFSVQLLEKIGAPLLAAIDAVSSQSEEETAQIMAQLLASSVQMSTSLYNMLEIKEDEGQMDSTRLSLAALSAPLIAESYIKQKQAPSEEHIKRMCESLAAVLTFGENFSPAADHQSRLQTIDHDQILFDKDQPILVVMQSMVPVINAVEEFSFGENRRKLVQDVATKIQSFTDGIAKKTGASDKLQELLIFKTLASLYASCHRTETKRAADSADRDNVSLAPVWESFETRVSMLEFVMGIEAEGVQAQSEGSVAPAAETPVEADPPAEAPKEPAPEKAAAPGGPMGFFKKPNTEEAAAAPAVTPTEAPVENKTTPEDSKTTPSDKPSSPMGFFKPGAKKEGE